jgi:hypothetical protein
MMSSRYTRSPHSSGLVALTRISHSHLQPVAAIIKRAHALTISFGQVSRPARRSVRKNERVGERVVSLRQLANLGERVIDAR